MRVIVVGDVMLDHYVYGQVNRISPEAPVPVVEFTGEDFRPGGAANTALGVAKIGAETELFGLVGVDEAAWELRKRTAYPGLNLRLRKCTHWSTPRKTRVVAHDQQLLRLDRETRPSAYQSRALFGDLRRRLETRDLHGVIVSDYAKGALSLGLLQFLARSSPYTAVDPKPKGLPYHGFNLLKPNRREAFEMAGMRDDGTEARLEAAARQILETYRPETLLITLGADGMALCSKDALIRIPTAAQAVYDVSGAGDTVLAVFTAAVLAKATLVEAAVLANHAAGIVVGRVGTSTVSAQDLLASFTGVPDVQDFLPK